MANTSARLQRVADALEQDAKQVGAARLAQGSTDASELLETATAQAERIVDQARSEGAAVGARLASATRADARREAREIVLGARADAYKLLRQSLIDELVRRNDSDEVRRLNTRLELIANELLAGKTTVRRDRLGIGIIADAGSRRVDSSADELVDSALATLGQALERLWS